MDDIKHKSDQIEHLKKINKKLEKENCELSVAVNKPNRTSQTKLKNHR